MLLTAVNHQIVPLVALISHCIKLLVASLNVPVTIKFVPLKYVHALLVNVTVGAVTSIFIGFADANVL